MKNAHVPRAVLSLLLLLGASVQAADEGAARDDKPVVLDTVKVEGERVESGVVVKDATAGVLGDLPLIEAPYSVSVINQHLLEIQQSSRYTDYLKNVPGANVGNVAIGFFSLRGFGVGTDGYLYDGLPGHVGLSETYQLDSFDRIEVFKGPTAFLNGFGGSTSLGGTLNYVPKRAGDEPLRSVELDYTNRSLFSVGGDVGERFGSNKQFGYRINARFRDGEQQAEHYDWTQKAASLALDWRASSTLSFAANFEYAHNHLPELPPFLLAGTERVPKAPDASDNLALSWDEFAATGKTAYLRSDWTFVDGWTLTAQALSSETERPYEKGARSGFILDEAGDTLLFGFVERSRLRNDSGQALVRGVFKTGLIDHRLTTGVSAISGKSYGGFASIGPEAGFQTNLYDPQDFPEPDGVPLPEELTGKSHGSSLLISDIVSLGERWSALLAARHARFTQNNFNEGPDPSVSKTSPSFALMFKPLPGSLLYVNYSEGLEQGSTADNTPDVTNAGDQLPAVITEQYEVGAKLEHRGMTYAAAVFDLKKPLERYIPAGETMRTFVQDGEQRHRGLELTATGELLPRLNLVAGVAFIDPETKGTEDPEAEGKRPQSVPRFTTNLFADYGLRAIPGLFVNAGIYHNASQYLDAANTLELKGWTRYDLGARYETTVAGTPTQLLFGIENVADRNYWIGQSGILTIADPLTVKMSLRFDL